MQGQHTHIRKKLKQQHLGRKIKNKELNLSMPEFFGVVSLLPFYIVEEIVVQRTIFNSNFFLWVLFAAISPGIIAFTLYTQAQKSLGASLTGFTLYIFTIYAAIYGFIFFDEKLESFHYLGTVLVFIGVYLAKKNYETKT
ncbi:DMT family transporter [Candidatus Pelagibacter sp.]|nr:DMT family transporter [Candidatus Pelagibacter sp.]